MIKIILFPSIKNAKSVSVPFEGRTPVLTALPQFTRTLKWNLGQNKAQKAFNEK